MAVAFVAASTGTAGASGDVASPGVPAGTAVGDFMLYVVANRDASTVGVPTGWLERTFTTSLVSGTALKLTVLYRFFQVADAVPALTRTGTTNAYIANVFSYRGVDPDTPFDVTPNGSVNAASSAAIAWATAIATATAGAKVLYLGAKAGLVTGINNNNDNFATASVTTPTNANLTNITERAEGGTRRGNDVVYVVGDADRATAGTTGTMSATLTGADSGVSIGAYIALRAAPVVESFSRTAASVVRIPGPVSALSASSPVTIPGLVNLEDYMVDGRARNAQGWGEWGAPAGPHTPQADGPPAIAGQELWPQ